MRLGIYARPNPDNRVFRSRSPDEKTQRRNVKPASPGTTAARRTQAQSDVGAPNAVIAVARPCGRTASGFTTAGVLPQPEAARVRRRQSNECHGGVRWDCACEGDASACQRRGQHKVPANRPSAATRADRCVSARRPAGDEAAEFATTNPASTLVHARKRADQQGRFPLAPKVRKHRLRARSRPQP
jgi:hypothetical protein